MSRKPEKTSPHFPVLQTYRTEVSCARDSLVEFRCVAERANPFHIKLCTSYDTGGGVHRAIAAVMSRSAQSPVMVDTKKDTMTRTLKQQSMGDDEDAMTDISKAERDAIRQHSFIVEVIWSVLRRSRRYLQMNIHHFMNSLFRQEMELAGDKPAPSFAPSNVATPSIPLPMVMSLMPTTSLPTSQISILNAMSTMFMFTSCSRYTAGKKDHKDHNMDLYDSMRSTNQHQIRLDMMESQIVHIMDHTYREMAYHQQLAAASSSSSTKGSNIVLKLPEHTIVHHLSPWCTPTDMIRMAHTCAYMWRLLYYRHLVYRQRMQDLSLSAGPGVAWMDLSLSAGPGVAWILDENLLRKIVDVTCCAGDDLHFWIVSAVNADMPRLNSMTLIKPDGCEVSHPRGYAHKDEDDPSSYAPLKTPPLKHLYIRRTDVYLSKLLLSLLPSLETLHVLFGPVRDSLIVSHTAAFDTARVVDKVATPPPLFRSLKHCVVDCIDTSSCNEQNTADTSLMSFLWSLTCLLPSVGGELESLWYRADMDDATLCDPYPVYAPNTWPKLRELTLISYRHNKFKRPLRSAHVYTKENQKYMNGLVRCWPGRTGTVHPNLQYLRIGPISDVPTTIRLLRTEWHFSRGRRMVVRLDLEATWKDYFSQKQVNFYEGSSDNIGMNMTSPIFGWLYEKQFAILPPHYVQCGGKCLQPRRIHLKSTRHRHATNAAIVAASLDVAVHPPSTDSKQGEMHVPRDGAAAVLQASFESLRSVLSSLPRQTEIDAVPRLVEDTSGTPAAAVCKCPDGPSVRLHSWLKSVSDGKVTFTSLKQWRILRQVLTQLGGIGCILILSIFQHGDHSDPVTDASASTRATHDNADDGKKTVDDAKVVVVRPIVDQLEWRQLLRDAEPITNKDEIWSVKLSASSSYKCPIQQYDQERAKCLCQVPCNTVTIEEDAHPEQDIVVPATSTTRIAYKQRSPFTFTFGNSSTSVDTSDASVSSSHVEQRYSKIVTSSYPIETSRPPFVFESKPIVISGSIGSTSFLAR